VTKQALLKLYEYLRKFGKYVIMWYRLGDLSLEGRGDPKNWQETISGIWLMNSKSWVLYPTLRSSCLEPKELYVQSSAPPPETARRSVKWREILWITRIQRQLT
jgi:hypothetical protein